MQVRGGARCRCGTRLGGSRCTVQLSIPAPSRSVCACWARGQQGAHVYWLATCTWERVCGQVRPARAQGGFGMLGFRRHCVFYCCIKHNLPMAWLGSWVVGFSSATSWHGMAIMAWLGFRTICENHAMTQHGYAFTAVEFGHHIF